jgi:hypothetical protein
MGVDIKKIRFRAESQGKHVTLLQVTPALPEQVMAADLYAKGFETMLLLQKALHITNGYSAKFY